MSNAARTISAQAELCRYTDLNWSECVVTPMDRHEMADKAETGLKSLAMIQESIKTWRERVFTGETEFAANIDDSLRGYLIRWIEITEEHVLPRIKEIEKVRDFNTVPRTAELRTANLTARRMLQEWYAPAVSKAAGLREDTLDEEETADVFASLRSNTARSTLLPRRITADD
jgi:hypothetical protein